MIRKQPVQPAALPYHLLHHFEGFGYARHVGEGHAQAFAHILHFATAEVGGGIGEDAVEEGAFVERTVGMDEHEDHLAVFQNQPLHAGAAAEATGWRKRDFSLFRISASRLTSMARPFRRAKSPRATP